MTTNNETKSIGWGINANEDNAIADIEAAVGELEGKAWRDAYRSAEKLAIEKHALTERNLHQVRGWFFGDE